MQFQEYLQQDKRLQKVDDLARFLYQHGGAHIHNYQHARWDTDQIIRIGEQVCEEDVSTLITAGLLHDTGVALGPYKNGNVDFHAANGARVPKIFLPNMGFTPEEVAKVSVAIAQHNGSDPKDKDQRKWFTSQALFDADTLNKAGIHGLEQYREVNREWGWDIETNRKDLTQAASRYVPYAKRLLAHGFYTDAAQEINREMGFSDFGGLELITEFWKVVEEKLKNGDLSAQEVMRFAKDHVDYDEATAQRNKARMFAVADFLKSREDSVDEYGDVHTMRYAIGSVMGRPVVVPEPETGKNSKYAAIGVVKPLNNISLPIDKMPADTAWDYLGYLVIDNEDTLSPDFQWDLAAYGDGHLKEMKKIARSLEDKFGVKVNTCSATKAPIVYGEGGLLL